MKVPYRCLYNHELLILATSQTPYLSYREPVSDRQTVGLVKEVCGTGVDALLICPQAWQTNLWISDRDRRWQDDAPTEQVPPLGADTKYFEKAYYRIREYMQRGGDPVALSISTARSGGLPPLFSYRMNECHYTNSPQSPTHSRFWKEHPHFMLDPRGSNLNYLEREVRDYHADLINELIDRYDIDGFECDFMRCPRYFPTDRVEEGREFMTEFIGKVRQKLDEVGRRRGKHLALGVRVPASPGKSLEIGLDLPRWDEAGWLDMVNVCFHPLLSQPEEVEGYRAILRNSSLYGELNYASQQGAAPGGYTSNIRRRPPVELYKSTALTLLERGADGVSLFNFGYWREHSFGEPRRKMYPGIEPPFSVISDLTSIERLRKSSQLLALTVGGGGLPRDIEGQSEASFRIHVGQCFEQPFARAVLRFESADLLSHLPLDARVNGHSGRAVAYPGELFPSGSLEALADPLKIVHFVIDPGALRPGFNEITLFNRWTTSGGGHDRGVIRIVRLEMGLYRAESDLMKFFN